MSDIHTEDNASIILNNVTAATLAVSILQNQKAIASKSSTMEIKPAPLEVRTQPAPLEVRTQPGTPKPISTFLILKNNNSHTSPPIKPDGSLYPQSKENHEEINESNLKLKFVNKIEIFSLDTTEISRCSYNYELRGPVRAALWASGPEQRENLRILEKEFGDSHNIPPSSTTPFFSLINADPACHPHSDPTPNPSPNPSPPLKVHDDRNLDNKHNLQHMREGRLYTACMTNPPFYDTQELVCHYICMCRDICRYI